MGNLWIWPHNVPVICPGRSFQRIPRIWWSNGICSKPSLSTSEHPQSNVYLYMLCLFDVHNPTSSISTIHGISSTSAKHAKATIFRFRHPLPWVLGSAGVSKNIFKATFQIRRVAVLPWLGRLEDTAWKLVALSAIPPRVVPNQCITLTLSYIILTQSQGNLRDVRQPKGCWFLKTFSQDCPTVPNWSSNGPSWSPSHAHRVVRGEAKGVARDRSPKATA